MNAISFLCAGVVAVFLLSREAHSQPLTICEAVAKDQLELFSIDKKTLRDRCKCVQNEHNGQLPAKKADWGVTGKTRPILTLIECSEDDIYRFYYDAVFNSAKNRMMKAGKRVESIEAFSASVAAGAFHETRRVAAIENGTFGQLDKVAFRRMYGQCEAAIN